MENIRFYFDKPLIRAIIESRINRFIFIVNLNGTKVEAHCPVGGTIAGIPRKEFRNIPCLMSDNSDNPNRRTRYTVEAISLDNGLTYAGINQVKSNNFVNHFLQDEAIQNTLNIKGPITREKRLGKSRIDFKSSDGYIEVKTMVAEYYAEASDHLRKLMKEQEPSIERLQKHIRELTNEVKTHNSKALVITVFQYNASKFNPPVDNPIYKDFIEDLKIAKACGVKQFQMNIKITDEYAELLSIIENEVI